MCRYENPQRKNKIDIPSFTDFHAQLDCKLTCLHAEVHRGSLIMAISSYHSKASLRNYIGRPSSEKITAFSHILSNALSGKSHQSLQTSFAALSSGAIFMFRWILLSFIQKTLALNSLFSTLSCEKTRVFLWAIIRLKFTEHFTSRFCIRDLKTSGKSVKFDLPNYFSL